MLETSFPSGNSHVLTTKSNPLLPRLGAALRSRLRSSLRQAYVTRFPAGISTELAFHFAASQT